MFSKSETKSLVNSESPTRKMNKHSSILKDGLENGKFMLDAYGKRRMSDNNFQEENFIKDQPKQVSWGPTKKIES